MVSVAAMLTTMVSPLTVTQTRTTSALALGATSLTNALLNLTMPYHPQSQVSHTPTVTPTAEASTPSMEQLTQLLMTQPTRCLAHRLSLLVVTPLLTTQPTRCLAHRPSLLVVTP